MPSLMQRSLVDYLEPVEFEPGQHTFRNIEPRTQFGWVVNADGEPERVEGPRVLVPVHDWSGVNEEALIARCLARAAEASPLKAVNRQSLRTGGFWQRVPSPHAVLIHPKMLGKVYHSSLHAMAFETVPENRVVILRQASQVGYHIRQGSLRGFLAHDRTGLFSVEFVDPP